VSDAVDAIKASHDFTIARIMRAGRQSYGLNPDDYQAVQIVFQAEPGEPWQWRDG